MLTDVLDAVPSAVALWDRDLRNRFANRTACVDWFGMTPEQLRGKHIRELLGPALYELNLPHIRKALGGRRQVFERVLETAAGERPIVQIEYRPFVVAEEVIGFVTILLDLTSRLHAERSAREAAAAIAAARERRRIEDRAHSVIMQELFATRLEIERARSTVPDGSPAATGLDSALARVSIAMADLRKTVAPASGGDDDYGDPRRTSQTRGSQLK
jgi:PAS domain S-box-containing protein